MFEYDPTWGRFNPPPRRSVRVTPAGGPRAQRPELEDNTTNPRRGWPVTPPAAPASNRTDSAQVMSALQIQFDELRASKRITFSKMAGTHHKSRAVLRLLALNEELRRAQGAAEEWKTQAQAAQREAAGLQKQYQAAQREAAAWQAHAASVQEEADTWQAQFAATRQALQAAQETLAGVQAESAELRTRWQKRYADEAQQEKQRFVLALLPFIDHLELAIQHDSGDAAALRSGVETTLRGVVHTLAQAGITPIDTLHQPFDPTVHEAVAVIPDAEAAPGTVVQVVQKGYLANGQLLRPARVVVSQ